MKHAPRRLLATLLASAALVSTVRARAQSKTFYLDRAQLSGAPDDGFMVWRPHTYEKTRFYGQFALGYTNRPLRADTVAPDARIADQISTPVPWQLISYLTAGTEVANRASFNIALPIAIPEGSGYGSHPAEHRRRSRREDRGRQRPKARRAGAPVPLRQPQVQAGCRRRNVAAHRQCQLLRRRRLPHRLRLRRGRVRLRQVPARRHRRAALPPEPQHRRHQRRAVHWRRAALGARRLRAAAPGHGPPRSRALGDDRHPEGHGRRRRLHNTAFASRNTDLEWLGQARFAIGKTHRTFINAGAGTKLTAGYGSPDFRILASIGSFFTISDKPPPSRPPGYKNVPDVSDYPKDTDGDGYPDDIDKCPLVKEDHKPPDPTDGCPAASDRDGDGIPDNIDKCPDDPEDKDGIQDNDGCPETDADNDGIPDTKDHCPTEPGPASKIASKNGCPQLTHVTESGEVQLLKPIQFEFAKATIKRVSYPILNEVVTLMKARPNIRIGVYGHTDNKGAHDLNMKLSKDRAHSVMEYLIHHGISSSRLESQGFGPDKPIVSNATAAGRAKNRRVEFKILNEGDDDELAWHAGKHRQVREQLGDHQLVLSDAELERLPAARRLEEQPGDTELFPGRA